MIFLFVLLLTTSLFAQNLQVHYDFGKGRSYFTTTLEMFKPDAYGSTFWFVDFDYNDAIKDKSASMAYWEIVRYFTLPFLKNSNTLNQLTISFQYNDGLNTFGSFGNVWLGGINYPIDLKIVTLNTEILLRKAENQDANFQLTTFWSITLFNGKLVFSGFLDVWGQDNYDFDADGTDSQIVILTEPQLWYNISKNLSVGSEVEISKNFIFGVGSNFKFMPTLGLKWDF